MIRTCLVAALALSALLAATARADAPPTHTDGAVSVSFGQVDTTFVLKLRTEAAGKVCVVIDRGGRLCVAGRVLRYDGRRVDAKVSRPDRRSLVARFGVGELPLRRGAFTWWVEAGADRVPDSGGFDATLSVLAQPVCFGAAARDRRRKRCESPPGLVPRPEDAPLVPGAPCRVLPRRAGVLTPCEFGVTGPRRTATFALIGDSHAATWRGALEVVAQAKRWRGVSITRPGCPFSVQIPSSPDLGPGECVALHRATLSYLRSSAIKTVFVSNWAQPGSGPHGGTGGYGGGAATFGAMLDALPRSVRHVYVLRDNPGASIGTPACVRARRSCSLARSAVLTPDPAAAAARSRGPRVRVIDLTSFFCSATRCFPEIGGAYVYKDDNHMNTIFSTTLGPFVLRAL